MRVAVIGAAGRMGRWFSGYFSSQGHEVVGYDLREKELQGLAEQTGIEVAPTGGEAAREADVVLVSVDISATPKAVEDLAPLLREGSSLVEISSLKLPVIKAMRGASLKPIITLSLHPLFGAGAKGLEGRKMALIPIKKRRSEVQRAKELFPKVELLVLGADAHDRAMAVVLSLTHFLNLSFSSFLAKEDIALLKRLSGTTFSLQLLLSEGVLLDDPSLLTSIQTQNSYASRIRRKFIEELGDLAGLCDEGRALEKRIGSLRESLGRVDDLKVAYEKIYSILEGVGSG